MDISEFTNADENILMEYVVFKENTLGYLFKSGGYLMLGVISGSVINGGLNYVNGPYSVHQEVDQLRPATEKDFGFFNVSSKGI